MKPLPSITALLAAVLLLAACGTTAPPENGNPGDPDPGNPPPSAECRETVTGNLTIPVTLNNGPEDCDFYFPGGKTYRVTAALTVEPGTVLRFGRDALLYFDDLGSIQAVGTEEARIVFTGELNVQGYWYGLCFSDNRESRLENVDVVWAGKVWATGSSCQGGISGAVGDSETVHIVGTRVFGSHTNGLNAHDLNLGDFAGNAFGGNSDYGVAIEASQVHRLDVGSDYLGTSLGETNGRPYVHVGGTLSMPGEMITWQNLNAPYIVNDYGYGYSSAVFVDDGTGLVLAPGIRMFFEGSSALFVWEGSGLWAMGEEDAPVVFSGVQPTRGSWRGISVSSSTAELHNVQILWAGWSSAGRGAGLEFYGVYDSAEKYLNGVHIAGSAGCGLEIEHDDLSLFLALANISFDNNEENYCGP